MRVLVLGSAAGGGFPQWNCNCANCRRARNGDGAAAARTQSSLAVSADGDGWVLLNASPDLRQQVLSHQQLWPRHEGRDSPIAGVVLTNGDVDHVAGLLSLRENHTFAVYATARVLRVLHDNKIFNVLNPAAVLRRELRLDSPMPLAGGDGAAIGLHVRAFAVPGKVALYLEDAAAGAGFGTQVGDTIGLEISDGNDNRFFYLPACASLTPEIAARIEGAALVLFDGTLWRDDEMISAGVGAKTGRRMGHMSMSGEDGSMAALAALDIRRKIYIHINNTNPVLLEDSPERAAAEAAGWEIARDGLEIRL